MLHIFYGGILNMHMAGSILLHIMVEYVVCVCMQLCTVDNTCICLGKVTFVCILLKKATYGSRTMNMDAYYDRIFFH